VHLHPQAQHRPGPPRAIRQVLGQRAVSAVDAEQAVAFDPPGGACLLAKSLHADASSGGGVEALDVGAQQGVDGAAGGTGPARVAGQFLE